MRTIADLCTTMQLPECPMRLRLALTVSACVLGVACSQTPTGPTTIASPTVTGEGGSGAISSLQGTSQTWQAFQAHGWNCRTPNNGPVTVCSPPGQPLPVVAFPPAVPPEDRPPTVMLKRWRDGIFEANVLLIRPEIYNGQICQSTGEAYFFASFLGYYECAHPPGN
jgi:hypothetical protein